MYAELVDGISGNRIFDKTTYLGKPGRSKEKVGDPGLDPLISIIVETKTIAILARLDPVAMISGEQSGEAKGSGFVCTGGSDRMAQVDLRPAAGPSSIWNGGDVYSFDGAAQFIHNPAGHGKPRVKQQVYFRS